MAMSFKSEDKIKPYTVIDLSTGTVLSPSQIDDCLQEATDKQRQKFFGVYACNGYHAKENGDAPNFVIVPPKVFIFIIFIFIVLGQYLA